MREYSILCCDVSCYYSKKKNLRDSDRSYTTQPVQICELAIYVLEQKKKKKKKKKKQERKKKNKKKKTKKKNNIIHFHLKIAMFYNREKLNFWPGRINLMFQVF